MYLEIKNGETTAQVMVDDTDYQWAKQFKWYLDKYAKRMQRINGKGVHITLHKEIAKRAKISTTGARIRFRNGNPLDCRRQNLRETSKEIFETVEVQETDTPDPLDTFIDRFCYPSPGSAIKLVDFKRKFLEFSKDPNWKYSQIKKRLAERFLVGVSRRTNRLTICNVSFSPPRYVQPPYTMPDDRIFYYINKEMPKSHVWYYQI